MKTLMQVLAVLALAVLGGWADQYNRRMERERIAAEVVRQMTADAGTR